MCGIFAYLGDKNNAGDLVLEGLKTLEYRGYDSWGVCIKLISGKLFIEKHVGKIGEARLPALKSLSGIGHTRWATHGGVTKANAHPHTDCENKIIIVHNGIVENFEEIKKELLKKGHIFKSETDTEVIAHLVEERLKSNKDLTKTVYQAFNELAGLNAIIVFYPDHNEFVAVKNGSPLIFGKTNKEFFLASDTSAILNHTDKVYFLEDNDLIHIDKNSYQAFDKNLKKKPLKFISLGYKKEQLDLGNHPHFMIKEISEQPMVLENLINNEKENIIKLSKRIREAYGTYLIGCGSAYYACIAGTYLFSKIAKRHINATVASEFSYLIDFLKEKSLVIALSQSGETIDIISPLREVKKTKAKISAITNVLGSSLYRMADYKMLLNAGPEKAVCSTKAFTTKIGILYLLAHSLNSGFDNGARNIKIAIEEVKNLINSKKILPMAKLLRDKTHIYIIGRGPSYATALESTLKIKEVSYIHAEGFAGGELKHGVIALIEKGTPVIIYNPEDETYKDTLSSAYEVKARGAFVIGISSIKDPVFDYFIPVKNCADATIIPNVVVAQLLGYYLALEKGYDPDKPRNLAKSVTVK